MKLRIPVILFVTSFFFLSGCYTQLQYSQRMNRITDEPRPSGTYAWDGTEKGEPQDGGERSATPKNYHGDDYAEGYDEGYNDGVEDAFHYKDYETAEWYARHGFGRYYYDPFPGYYGFSHWRYHHYYDPFFHDFYYPRSYASFSLSFHFGPSFGFGAFYGYPYRWYRHHYYSHWYRYHPYSYRWGYNPVFINNFYYGGYANYVGPGKDRVKDRAYGRRSIGTDRVRSGYTTNSGDIRGRSNGDLRQKSRSRSTTIRDRGTSRTGVTRDKATVRTRTSDNGRVRGTRTTGRTSGSTGSGTTRRTRGNDNYSNSSVINNNSDSQIRSRRYERYREQQREDVINRERIQNRIKNWRVPDNHSDDNRRSRFFDTMRRDLDRAKNFRMDLFNNNHSRTRSRTIDSDNSRNTNSRSRTTVRSRSSTNSGRGTVSSPSRSRSSSKGRSSSGSSSNRRSRGN
ncbi:MAG: hypothetical protein R3281_00480 [Balneolaceae bacterium]|nr:hypothetical protein [Balneolaceae bacterium]